MSIHPRTWIERARAGDCTRDEIMVALKEAERKVRVLSGALAIATERNRIASQHEARPFAVTVRVSVELKD